MNRKKYIFPLALLAAALVIEILPFSLNFITLSESGEKVFTKCSYFYGAVFNSGELGPLMTGMFTVCMVLITVTLLVRHEPSSKQHKNMVLYSFVTMAASLTPRILGREFYSVYSLVVTLLMLGAGILFALMTNEVKVADRKAEQERMKWEAQVEKAKRARQAAEAQRRNSGK